MKAEFTMTNLYWNRGLRGFFFRSQSTDTLAELINRAKGSTDDVLSQLDVMTEDKDADDVEEDFYSLKVEELAEEYGIELEEDEEDVEEECDI